jgi:hypothetical protein
MERCAQFLGSGLQGETHIPGHIVPDGEPRVRLDIPLINDRDHEIRSYYSNHKDDETRTDVLQVVEPC